jgi:predicted PurR-regulated permease PerM
VTQGTSAFEPDVPGPPPDPGAGEEVAQPDIKKLGEALRERVEIRSLSITGLFVLASFYTLYFARAFFLPIILAVLLDFLLSPLIRALKRARIPEPLGAALVIVALLGTAGAAGYGLVEPAKEWVGKLPGSMREAGDRLRKLRTPVEQVSKTAEQVEKVTKMDDQAKTPEVVVKGPTLTERLFGTTQTIVASAVEVIILLYFLLAAGDLFLQKLIKVLPQLRDKKKAVAIARETEASISTYLVTVTLVNLGLGLAVAAVMFLLKMPNPLLWGALAALAEFVPYLGATALIALLFLVPAAYLGVNVLQSQFISPLILGRRLTLNPVAIFIGLVFWWWIWGVPGAFIAVPLIATFKIFCDHIEALAPIGEFLGR